MGEILEQTPAENRVKQRDSIFEMDRIRGAWPSVPAENHIYGGFYQRIEIANYPAN